MSFSFTIKGETRDEVMQRAEAEFATILAQQPIHDRDHGVVLSTIELYLDLLDTTGGDGKLFNCSVCGSLTWLTDSTTENPFITGASISVNAWIS